VWLVALNFSDWYSKYFFPTFLSESCQTQNLKQVIKSLKIYCRNSSTCRTSAEPLQVRSPSYAQKIVFLLNFYRLSLPWAHSTYIFFKTLIGTQRDSPHASTKGGRGVPGVMRQTDGDTDCTTLWVRRINRRLSLIVVLFTKGKILYFSNHNECFNYSFC